VIDSVFGNCGRADRRGPAARINRARVHEGAMSSKCASWACSAAMAFNMTASLFSGFSTAMPSSACRALNNNALCTPHEAHLLFGNTTG